jgi:hypothetical protein
MIAKHKLITVRTCVGEFVFVTLAVVGQGDRVGRSRGPVHQCHAATTAVRGGVRRSRARVPVKEARLRSPGLSISISFPLGA